MEGACRSCGKCSGHINSETMRRLLLENFTRCNISNKVATFSLFLDRSRASQGTDGRLVFHLRALSLADIS